MKNKWTTGLQQCSNGAAPWNFLEAFVVIFPIRYRCPSRSNQPTWRPLLMSITTCMYRCTKVCQRHGLSDIFLIAHHSGQRWWLQQVTPHQLGNGAAIINFNWHHAAYVTSNILREKKKPLPHSLFDDVEDLIFFFQSLFNLCVCMWERECV